MAGVEEVPPGLILNGNEVGAAVKQRGMLIRVPGCRMFRLRGKKLPHFPISAVFNCFSDGPPLFVVVPGFVSAYARFQSIHGRKLYVANPHSGWMPEQIREEWAEWAEWGCPWLEIYRAEHGLEASPAVLVPGKAPSRNHERAMRVSSNTASG
jgi:hypothetical protein